MNMDKVQMEIIGLTSSPQGSGAYALILQETGGMRRLSILIGQDLAQSIAMELEQIRPPRPVTHDLLKNIIEAMGANLVDVTITDIRDETFYATLSFDTTADEVDARPSDAIALAIRWGAPIYVSEAVLNAAGVVAQEEAEEEEDEEDDEMLEQVGSVDVDRPKTQREVLQGKLDEAVKNEDYERAAQIRDEIDRLG